MSYFLEFIDIVFILLQSFIEFVTLLYAFLVIPFAQYKEYVIWRISFQMYCQLLLVQELLVIFEEFVQELTF